MNILLIILMLFLLPGLYYLIKGVMYFFRERMFLDSIGILEKVTWKWIIKRYLRSIVFQIIIVVTLWLFLVEAIVLKRFDSEYLAWTFLLVDGIAVVTTNLILALIWKRRYLNLSGPLVAHAKTIEAINSLEGYHGE